MFFRVAGFHQETQCELPGHRWVSDEVKTIKQDIIWTRFWQRGRSSRYSAPSASIKQFPLCSNSGNWKAEMCLVSRFSFVCFMSQFEPRASGQEVKRWLVRFPARSSGASKEKSLVSAHQYFSLLQVLIIRHVTSYCYFLLTASFPAQKSLVSAATSRIYIGFIAIFLAAGQIDHFHTDHRLYNRSGGGRRGVTRWFVDCQAPSFAFLNS